MQRHEALAEYLNGLGLDYGEGPRVIPERLAYAGRSVNLDTWERGVLQASFSKVEGPGKPWAPLLAEGIAFQFKCQRTFDPTAPHETKAPAAAPDADIEQDAADAALESDADLDPLERLIVDAAVGLALMAEMQRAIDELVVAGEMAEAKKLTGFRNKVAQAVGELKEIIGCDAYERAENKSGAMIASRGPETRVSGSNGATPARAGLFAKKKAGTPRPSPAASAAEPARRRKPKNLRPKLLMLLAATLAWTVFFLPRLFRTEAPLLQTLDFRGLPGVVEVTPRPPSLFVRVDDATWSRLTDAERVDLIERIGAVADQATYVGVQVRLSTSGAPVGQWLKKTGARLADPS